jgi:hypothetical protein
MTGDKHDQSEATGSQTRSTPSAHGRPQPPAGEEPSAPGPQATEGEGTSHPKGASGQSPHISQRK